MSTIATATPATQAELNARNSALFRMLQPHRQSDVMQRITLFVVEKTGKKLADYMHDHTVSFEDRIALIDELTEITKALDWSKLPAIPNGQAAVTPPAATPAPTPAPAAPKPAAPRALEPAAPKPAAPKPTAEVAAPVSVGVPQPTSEATDDVLGALEEEDAEEADPIATITAQLRKLAAQPKAKAITEADVRRIVRQELATVLTSIADVLKK